MRRCAYGHAGADSDRDPDSDLLTFDREFSWARDLREPAGSRKNNSACVFF